MEIGSQSALRLRDVCWYKNIRVCQITALTQCKKFEKSLFTHLLKATQKHAELEIGTVMYRCARITVENWELPWVCRRIWLVGSPPEAGQRPEGSGEDMCKTSVSLKSYEFKWLTDKENTEK